MNFPFMLVLGVCLCLSVAPAARGFIALEHEGGDDLNTLVKKVHADHWVIHYSYGDDCLPEQRNNDAALTAAVTEALQLWLQPLRENTNRPIVNDFRYKLNDDWQAADFGITFYCEIRNSNAHIGRSSPGISLRRTTNVELRGFMSGLVHEMGHIFGLADTYVRVADWGKPGFSKGGLDSTIGTQPAAIMAGNSMHRDGKFTLGKDDKNGIIYLYKLAYEGLSIRDCFFTDYELEDDPRGCVPKHPLIFEIKHGIGSRVLEILDEDENLDVNAQNEKGMTALHYAVIRFAEENNAPDDKAVIEFSDVVKVLLALDDITPNTQTKDGMTALHYAVSHELDEVVEELLSHKDILPFLRNKQGHSPLQIARENKLDRMITLLLEHPLTLPVSTKGKLATTWGHLKKQY